MATAVVWRPKQDARQIQRHPHRSAKNAALNVYVDPEFTSISDPRLISIGAAAGDGREVSPPNASSAC